MLVTQIYLWSHAALFAAMLLAGIRRLYRREALALFGEDVIYILLVFVLAGGGAVGTAQYLA